VGHVVYPDATAVHHGEHARTPYEVNAQIFAYVAVNIVFSSIKIEPFHNSMYFYGHPEVQLARMIADRTGIMSFYNMVIMWLFAGRNDVLIWISGWSFRE
jgi:hypothetical protein